MRIAALAGIVTYQNYIQVIRVELRLDRLDARLCPLCSLFVDEGYIPYTCLLRQSVF